MISTIIFKIFVGRSFFVIGLILNLLSRKYKVLFNFITTGRFKHLQFKYNLRTEFNNINSMTINTKLAFHYFSNAQILKKN